MKVEEAIQLLEKEYGQSTRRRRLDPLSELIATILSQNTSDVNSGRAFDSLLSTFSSWDRVVDAGTEEIAAAIVHGGLSRVKAPRIKAILEKIRRDKGSLDLAFLDEMPLDDARRWLQSLPGVGPKTAACVLLFSLDKPAFPVDTHVYRVSRRLGLIQNGISPDKAHRILESLVPADAVYQFHMNMVTHGRRVCRAQRPRCHECILMRVCDYAKGKV
jgi:endonuclease-3